MADSVKRAIAELEVLRARIARRAGMTRDSDLHEVIDILIRVLSVAKQPEPLDFDGLIELVRRSPPDN
jgi:hypothetical protein